MREPSAQAVGQRLRYRALDAAGDERRGELLAADEGAAARQLIEQGLTPVQLTPVGTGVARAAVRRAPRDAERALFLQELATLLGAGISLTEALPSLAQAYASQALGPALARLDSEVRAGRSVAQALADSGMKLPGYVQAMIDAGDAAGRLAEACGDAAAQMEHELRIRAELRNALIYPVILVAAGTLAVLIIFLGVVPRFASILRNPRADVPTLSRWVIEAGVYMQQHWLALALALTALLALGAAALRSSWLRQRLQEWLAGLPVLGPWLVEAETGRWALLLGSLLQHRVPIVQALRLSSGVLALGSLRKVLERSGAELERGLMLSDVLAREQWFPLTRLNLIRVGERSGELAGMMLRLGQLQIEAARMRQKRLLALVEPIAILTIGVVIAVIMIAVMMAITSLNTMAA